MKKTLTTSTGVKRVITLKNYYVFQAGIEKLAKILDVTPEEARELKEQFFDIMLPSRKKEKKE